MSDEARGQRSEVRGQKAPREHRAARTSDILSRPVGRDSVEPKLDPGKIPVLHPLEEKLRAAFHTLAATAPAHQPQRTERSLTSDL